MIENPPSNQLHILISADDESVLVFYEGEIDDRKRIEETLRESDYVFRLGGDEFTILLPETDMFTASSVAERVRQYIAGVPVQTNHGNLDVTISLGIARATDDISDLDKLIRQADSAMYTAKNGGRNRTDFV